MKRIATAMLFSCLVLAGFAQEEQPRDTSVRPENDTIRVGNIIIIRSGKDRDKSYYDTTQKTFRKKNDNVTTNWWVVDLGFNRVIDETNYANAIGNGFLPAGAQENWFNQRNFKSTNVNIWFVMQKLNLLHHVMNVKYGIGIELNNYKYRENIRYQNNNLPLVLMDETLDYKKNKLAADYITVPLMLNFTPTPNKKNAFSFSVGVSAGYLYSARQKIVTREFGKQKFREDFDLRDFKISYVGDISVGWLTLYASLANQSMFKNTLDQTPFNFGIRLSHL